MLKRKKLGVCLSKQGVFREREKRMGEVSYDKTEDNIDLFPAGYVPVSKLYKNVNQELITITVDKLKYHLKADRESEKNCGKWHKPLYVLATIVTTLITTEKFSNLGFTSSQWEAIWKVACIPSLLWLLCAAITSKKSKPIPEIIEELKGKNQS